MKVLDLFSGIGGFALAFEAAGFQTVAFAEIEPYPCKVLKQHWPHVPNLGDVRKIDGKDFAGVDVVCGGFPCQDISTAGKGAGIHGERSGLWFEMLRIIRGARPAFCLLENVPALRSRGADVVLGGLEEAGYTGRPFVVGAVNAGAPHRRQRVWIVAYRRGIGCEWREGGTEGSESDRENAGRTEGDCGFIDGGQGCFQRPLAVSSGEGLQGPSMRIDSPNGGWSPVLLPSGSDWWAVEPALGRVAHGVPHRAHRIKALGNSIVPAVAYPFAVWIRMQLQARSAGEAPCAEPSPSSPSQETP